MNYRYVVFSPYFGKLPNTFNLWLKSCEYNKNFKFIVFTDDKNSYVLPDNVIIIQMTFNSFKEKLQKKFDFSLGLNTPYKLCDFKPTYGYALDEYLNNCEYWGHCDLDMIFGDLEKFLPNKQYDKISTLGHLCLYRNCKTINKAFMLKGDSSIDYKDILGNDLHFGFDEIGDYGINKIFEINKLSVYNYEENVADISILNENMTITIKKDGKFHRSFGDRIFSFENGKILSHTLEDDKIKIQEFAYIHIKKRKMHIDESIDYCKFIITYKEYKKYEVITKEIIMTNQPPKRMINKYWIKSKLGSIKVRMNRRLKIRQIIKEKFNEK